jgi:proline dehydrogenase
VLRQVLLSAARSGRAKNLVTTMPVTREIVTRFVAGESADDAVRVTRALIGDGLLVTLDHLGEDTLDLGQAEAVAKAYLTVLGRLADAGLTSGAEVSVKLSAVGLALPDGGERIALEHAARICEAARSAGTTVTLDMEDHTATDSTLRILTELRRDHPDTGGVLQAYLRRTEADCRDLAYPGSRVRLCKGAYNEPPSVAYTDGHDVDRSFVRCLSVLMAGQGYPMVATHDPRLVRIARTVAAQHGRTAGDYELQMLYGVRRDEQRRLAAAGEKMRVYVPYGAEWYGYLMRRLAERPANVGFFVRSIVSNR